MAENTKALVPGKLPDALSRRYLLGVDTEECGTDVAVHTLRHSAATTWLENGVHLKAVSELLGHASIAITADIYGHLSEETARGAMATLSDAIGI